MLFISRISSGPRELLAIEGIEELLCHAMATFKNSIAWYLFFRGLFLILSFDTT